MEIGYVRTAHHLRDRPLLLIVSDSAIKGFIGTDVEFGLLPKQGRQTSLRIEIDGENTISVKRKRLGQMRRRRRFSTATLEIHHRNVLQWLGPDGVRAVTASPASSLV